MAIPAINILGNPNVTEGNFQLAIEDLRKSVIGSGKAYDSVNTYSQYDTCVYSGVVYYSKINSNTGNTPAIGTNWGLESELIKLIASPTTNAIPKINADGTIANSNIIIDNNGNLNLGSVANHGGMLSINVAQTSSYAKYLTLRDSSSGTLLDFSTYGDPSYGASNIINFTGAYLAIRQSGAERMRIDTNGNLLLTSGTGGLGYGAGAGGTVTQLTSKSTAVTLNKPTGQITMNNAALAAGATASFSLVNSLITTTDTIIVNCYNFINYRTDVRNIGTGGCTVNVTNLSAGSLSDAIVINFTVIKGANA